MCYNVFTVSTTEHISIRLPKHIVQHLRKEAEREHRSLSWMIGYRLAQLNTSVDEDINHVKPTTQHRAVHEAQSRTTQESITRTGRTQGSHDPKTCRIYGCLMCKMAKDDKVVSR